MIAIISSSFRFHVTQKLPRLIKPTSDQHKGEKMVDTLTYFSFFSIVVYIVKELDLHMMLPFSFGLVSFNIHLRTNANELP